jgi:predicted ATPase
MHLTRLTLDVEGFPTREHYPFDLEVLQKTRELAFTTPVTFFIGENGSGKSTLLSAIARKCEIPIWRETGRLKMRYNKYAERLHYHLQLEWTEGRVPGSFFGSEIFRDFAEILDEWAKADPGILKYFGGESLATKSHGQCNLAYFKARYAYRGLHLLDEPETALSPKKQIELLQIIQEISKQGHAQFIIASHSPILLALPGAVIYSFDHIPVRRIDYEETDYYRVYREFLNDRSRFSPCQ